MKIVFNSPVILAFSLICAVVLFVDRMTGSTFLMDYFSVGGSINYTNPAHLLSLFTHVIGHANMEHLLSNLTFILLLGPIIEEKYGSTQTLLMIVITALITGLLNIYFFDTGLLGASGIVFMLILLASFTNTRNREIPVTFILVALLFIGKEVWNSLGNNNISEFAHIIGGFCGSLFGFVMKPKR